MQLIRLQCYEGIDEAKALYERFLASDRDNGDLVQPSLARLKAGQVPPATVGSLKDGLAEALFDLASVLNQRDTQDLALIYARLTLELAPAGHPERASVLERWAQAAHWTGWPYQPTGISKPSFTRSPGRKA